jgi:hypothetical protein
MLLPQKLTSEGEGGQFIVHEKCRLPQSYCATWHSATCFR